MSMLDDIKAAEEAAVADKKEAAINARNLIRESEDAANAEAKSIIATARESAKNMINAADMEAKEKARVMIGKKADEERFAAEAARRKLDEAATYIVEKVVI